MSPYVVIADLRAASSSSKVVPEVQSPRRRVTSSAIAAGMADMGVLVVPPCYRIISLMPTCVPYARPKLTIMVYNLALLKALLVPSKFFDVLK